MIWLWLLFNGQDDVAELDNGQRSDRVIDQVDETAGCAFSPRVIGTTASICLMISISLGCQVLLEKEGDKLAAMVLDDEIAFAGLSSKGDCAEKGTQL